MPVPNPTVIHQSGVMLGAFEAAHTVNFASTGYGGYDYDWLDFGYFIGGFGPHVFKR